MSRPLVVAGMHRSGTSLAAGLMHRARVPMGSQLLGANYDNPRGFFEDEAFRQWHERVLQSQGRTPFGPDFEMAAPNASDQARARALVESRGRNSWGFKDPRTTLFLDFWDGLLPDARYVFLYRHPAEVALSLLRRGDLQISQSPWTAMRAWQAYNQRLLDFALANRDRVLVVNPHAVAERPSDLVAAVGGLLDDPRIAETAVEAFPQEITRLAANLDWRDVIAEQVTLYADLETMADLPAPAAPTPDGSARERARAASEGLLFHLLALTEPSATTMASRLATVLEDAQRALAESQQAVEALQRALEESQQEARHLQDQLSTIEASRSYRWIQMWWRLRRLSGIAPTGRRSP